MKKNYSGVDGTKGFVYSWDSKDKNVGAGGCSSKSCQQSFSLEEGWKEEVYLINFFRLTIFQTFYQDFFYCETKW